MPNGNDLINAARSQLNVKEEPLNSNSGPMVNTYLDYVGSPPARHGVWLLSTGVAVRLVFPACLKPPA